MNVMIKSDLITMKHSALQLVIMPLVIAVFIDFMTGSIVVGVGAIAAMVPFMFIFSIVAYDELNGWERFRLTLPITRRQVAFGRYGSTLIVVLIWSIVSYLFAVVMGAVNSLLPTNIALEGASTEMDATGVAAGAIVLAVTVMLIAAAFAYPFIMRFGLTKATRLVPVALVLLIALLIWLVGDSGLLDRFLPKESLDSFWELNSFLITAGALCVSLILYGLSALVSAWLYERRQF